MLLLFALEDLGELEEDLLAFGLELRLAGIEEDAVEDVDGEAALEFGDGDVPGFEFRTHLLFEGGSILGRFLHLLFEFGGLGSEHLEFGGEDAVGAGGGLRGQASCLSGFNGGPVGELGFADLEESDGSQEKGAQDGGKQPDLLWHGWDSNVPAPTGQWGSRVSRA